MKAVLLLIVSIFVVTGTAQAQMPPPVSYPPPTGSYPVGRTAYQWTDTNRRETFTEDPTDNRQTPVTIWYPAQTADAPPAAWVDLALARGFAAQTGLPLQSLTSAIVVHARRDAAVAESGAPFPVLIMAHGSGLLPEFYTQTAEALASHGYFVVGVSHPYNARAALLSGGEVVLAAPEADPQQIALPPTASILEIAEAIDARGARLLEVQAADLRFVLDQIVQLNTADARFKGRLDTEHIGVFGHSFGGAAALTALLADARFDAAALIDSSLFVDLPEGSNRPLLGIFAQATLALATPSAAEIASLGLRFEDVARAMRPMSRVRELFAASPRATLVAVADADHMNFTDSALLSGAFVGFSDQLGAIDPALAVEITNAYLLAFFDETLRAAPPRLGELPAQFPQSTLQSAP